MFDKKDDRLFDYAFGDLDSQEAQMFEASLLKDEAGLSEVEFLKSLKQDLVGLRDIPEMQYSKERLRAAILEQGLKPKRSLPWLNWVLAPSAVACVAALGFVLMNGTSPKNLVYIPDSNKTATKTTADKIEFKEATPNVAMNSKLDRQEPSIDIDEYLYSEPTKSVVNMRNKSARTSSRSRVIESSSKEIDAVITPTELREEVTKAVNGGVAGIATTDRTIPNATARMDASLKAIVLGGAGPGALSHSESDAESTLIMIDKERDSGVGAAVATEVKNTAHVVIGG